MKPEMRKLLMPAMVLFLICVFSSAALAGTNAATKERIIQAQIQLAEESRRIVFPEAEGFSEEEDYFVAEAAGEAAGYIFETESKGYGGTIRVMTGITAEGKINGVVILSHAETPGLGANASKAEFRAQYEQSAPNGGVKVIKGTPGEGEISAITGATITSNAVTDAVNQAIARYQALKGGE